MPDIPFHMHASLSVWPVSAMFVFIRNLCTTVTILREMGLQVNVYIDDILLMTDWEAQLRENKQDLVFLLKNLVFAIILSKIKNNFNNRVNMLY